MFTRLIVIIGLLLSHVALAQPPRRRVTLQFETPADLCFEESSFRDRVAARLGYDPFVAASEQSVRVVVRSDDVAIEVQIETHRVGEQPGLRELDGGPHECSRLLDATVLAVSIAVDPTVLSRPESPPEALPDPSPEPLLDPPPVEHAPPVATPDPAPPTVSGGLYVGVTGSVGLAPSVASFGMAIGAELRVSALRIGLAVRADAPGTTNVDGGSVRAHVFGGELSVCGYWSPLLLCSVAFAGATRGEGDGFGVDEEAYVVHLALGVRVGVELLLVGPVSFRSQLDLSGHLTPAEFQVGDETVWSMPPLSVTLGVGIALQL